MTYKSHKCRRILKRNFDKIEISGAFKRCPPKKEKYHTKLINYIATKKLDPIIVDENNVLVDGYCSYLIAKQNMAARRKAKIYRAKGVEVRKQRNIRKKI